MAKARPNGIGTSMMVAGARIGVKAVVKSTVPASTRTPRANLDADAAAAAPTE